MAVSASFSYHGQPIRYDPAIFEVATDAHGHEHLVRRHRTLPLSDTQDGAMCWAFDTMDIPKEFFTKAAKMTNSSNENSFVADWVRSLAMDEANVTGSGDLDTELSALLPKLAFVHCDKLGAADLLASGFIKPTDLIGLLIKSLNLKADDPKTGLAALRAYADAKGPGRLEGGAFASDSAGSDNAFADWLREVSG